MRLYEFAGKDPVIVKLAVLSDHLQSMLDNGEIEGEWTTDDLIEYLGQNGVNIGKPDIYDMAKKSSLSNILSITDDVVTFKGQEPTQAEADPSQSQKVVQQMAKDAMK